MIKAKTAIAPTQVRLWCYRWSRRPLAEPQPARRVSEIIDGALLRRPSLWLLVKALFGVGVILRSIPSSAHSSVSSALESGKTSWFTAFVLVIQLRHPRLSSGVKNPETNGVCLLYSVVALILLVGLCPAVSRLSFVKLLLLYDWIIMNKNTSSPFNLLLIVDESTVNQLLYWHLLYTDMIVICSRRWPAKCLMILFFTMSGTIFENI